MSTTTLPTTPSFRLDGKRALVTGASSGIGLACAAALAQAGADTVLAARRREELEAAADAIRGDGGKAEVLVLDVADIAAVAALVADGGPFDVLVNSAGTARHSPAIETTAEDFDTVVGLNLRGAYFLTRAVARGLIAAGRPGSLINISSQMGLVGGIERAVYCASKHAVEGFTKAMAIEFGPRGIRVNTICPTFIRTPLKLGRIGGVEDIMGAVVYLASDARALVTGISHLVDGGWTAD